MEKQHSRDIYALEKTSKGYGRIWGIFSDGHSSAGRVSDAQRVGLEGQKMSPLEKSLLEEPLSIAGAVYNENTYSIHVYPTILSPALMPW